MRKQAAFTLVELIVATTVTVMVAAGTVGMLRSSAAVRQRVQRQTALQGEARAALRTMAAAVANAFRGPKGEMLLQGRGELVENMPADRMRLRVIDPRDVRQGQPESDVKEVEFFLAMPDGQEQLEPLPVLMQRIDPTRNAEPDGGGILQRVAGGVAALAFGYFDGAAWRSDWDSKSDGWPLAVRIELAVCDVRGGEPWTVSRLVSFPHAATAGGESSGESSGASTAEAKR